MLPGLVEQCLQANLAGEVPVALLLDGGKAALELIVLELKNDLGLAQYFAFRAQAFEFAFDAGYFVDEVHAVLPSCLIGRPAVRLVGNTAGLQPRGARWGAITARIVSVMRALKQP